jgi:hypothetical protein
MIKYLQTLSLLLTPLIVRVELCKVNIYVGSLQL